MTRGHIEPYKTYKGYIVAPGIAMPSYDIYEYEIFENLGQYEEHNPVHTAESEGEAEQWVDRQVEPTRVVTYPPRIGVIPKLPEEAKGDFLFFEYIRDLCKYRALSAEDARRLWEGYKRPKGSSSNPGQLGTCYEDAWRYLVKQGEGYLIHGSVQLTEEGARVKHAWVELPTGYVWEPQTGQHLTHEGFQMLSPMEEHRYTVEEAAIMVARVGKHGPWTDEERTRWLKS